MDSTRFKFMKEKVGFFVFVTAVATVTAVNFGVLDVFLGRESAAAFRSRATHGDVDWFVASLDGFESRPEIVVLRPEEADTQQPHENDEVYHVVRGFGQLTIGDRVEHVGPGTLVRVDAGVPHRFHNVQDKLVVLVFPNHDHH